MATWWITSQKIWCTHVYNWRSLQEVSSKGEVTKRSLRAAEKLLKPTRIEEVPFRCSNLFFQTLNFSFRRQDRRTLNARYRRRMDRRLILCIAGSSLLLLALGNYFVVSQFCFIGQFFSSSNIMFSSSCKINFLLNNKDCEN